MSNKYEIIDLEEFLSNKKRIHNENITNFNEGLVFLLENEKNTDIITYNSSINFLVYNVDMFKINKEGFLYHDFTIERVADIISDIQIENISNVKIEITYLIANKELTSEKIKEFVMCASIYTEFKVRITFLEKPKYNDIFKIIIKNYLLNTNDKQILSRNAIKTKNVIYNNGVAEIIQTIQ